MFYGQIVLALSCERVRTFNYYFYSVHAVNAEVRVRWGLCNLLLLFPNLMRQWVFNMPAAKVSSMSGTDNSSSLKNT